MAIKNTSIWIKSSVQPTVALPTPTYKILSGITGLFQHSRALIPASNDSETTYLFLNVRKKNELLPTPKFKIQFSIDIGGTDNSGFSFEDDTIIYTRAYVTSSDLPTFGILNNPTNWKNFADDIWNKISKGVRFSLDGGNYVISRSADLNVETVSNSSQLTFVNNDADNVYAGPIPSTPVGGASITNPGAFPEGANSIFNFITYDANATTTEAGPDFKAGSFIADGKILNPIPNWFLTLPFDTFNAVTKEVNNLNDLWEIQATYDDALDHNPLTWNGLPFKAGQVVSDNFKNALVTLAAPGIKNISVTTSQNVSGNTIVDLAFSKTDNKTDDVQFVIPKPNVDVIDYELNVSEEPIDVRVVDEPTIVNIINETQDVQISTPVTDINFTGNDRTNVDLTVDSTELALKVDQVDVVFQNHGTQGQAGSGFIQVFRASINQPVTPVGGSFNFSTSNLTAPDGWTATIPALGELQEVWGSFAYVKERQSINWSIPFQVTRAAGGGTAGGAAVFRIAEPQNPPIGLLWVRRFFYSQNIRVGNQDTSSWLELIPGADGVELDANGTDTERDDFLKLDANTLLNTNRSLLDYVDSDNIGRKQ